MDNMEYRTLPIGTIVELKESTKKLIIAGYCPMGTARPGYVWDYSGFAFPEGYVQTDQIYQFDQDQIVKIVAYGYQDEEQMNFRERLKQDLTEVVKDQQNKED